MLVVLSCRHDNEKNHRLRDCITVCVRHPPSGTMNLQLQSRQSVRRSIARLAITTLPKLLQHGVSTMAIVLNDEKVCTRCGRNQPISSFKRRSRGQGRRLSWCKGCVNHAARLRTIRQQATVLGQAAKYIQPNSNASRVECVVAAACRQVGGVEKFAARLSSALESSNAAVSLKAARLFFCLLAASDRLRVGD